MLRIITDFDGPIMDVSERYYRVYLYCLAESCHPGQAVNRLSKSEFWRLKRSQVPERQIGHLSGLDQKQASTFASLRRTTVHTAPYLKYDTPVPGAIETLERLQTLRIDLAVMTMRRECELEDAFNRYHLTSFFPSDRRYCLSNDYVKASDVKDKPLLMQKALSERPSTAETWMIGDTEADIIAAKIHGVKSIGVLCGIRDRTQLSQHEPDWLTPNLSTAVDLILSQAA
ncbi:HAD family hydrolase [Oculatella sp. LEGE 06141]|uniref:HAD family hydrolase n=1 Tax=Oculatella sp. LEGE 06141 TaxID=1828648 RepID=UPI001882EF1C|nr:HAD family hydrolase [Oculatella sp. LEGE 06141]MBE9179189.1 HAD family hydrolase [Oculatella sp. LEGE 06141]